MLVDEHDVSKIWKNKLQKWSYRVISKRPTPSKTWICNFFNSMLRALPISGVEEAQIDKIFKIQVTFDKKNAIKIAKKLHLWKKISAIQKLGRREA